MVDIKIIKQTPSAELFPTTETATQLEPGKPVTIKDGDVQYCNVNGSDFDGVTIGRPGDEKAGFVRVLRNEPGITVYEAKATTAANVAATLLGDAAAFTNSTGTFTVNEDAAAGALTIVGVDTVRKTVEFTVDHDAIA